jgi:hypothetical protein
MRHPHDAYQIAVSYGSDAKTTIIQIKILTFKRGVIGHEFTTSLDDIDTFIKLVRSAIAGDINEDSPLSIRRFGEKVIFDTQRNVPIMMELSIATFMVAELDELQTAIDTFLDARVVFLVAA